MTEAANHIERALTQLAADPAFASFAGAETGMLVWDAGVDRILWASAPARKLHDALADPSGRIALPSGALDRLRALAAGLAPSRGMRLERLRLDPSRHSPPVTCACRVADLDTGERVLVTAIMGPIPQPTARRQEPEAMPSEPPAEPPHEPEATFVASSAPVPAPANASSAPAPANNTPANTPRPRGTVRFIWQADPDTRFTHVSPQLAEVVGPMAADILGQTWEEVACSVVDDPDGAVASQFARRQTWSGRLVRWAIDNTAQQVPVEWAGMPVWGQDRRLIGFRGFGLLRTDEVRELPEPAAEASPTESPAGVPATEQALPDEDRQPVECGGNPIALAPEPVEERVSDQEENPSRAPSDEIEVPVQANEIQEAPAEPTVDRDASWFTGIRERVAATLNRQMAPFPGEPAEVRETGSSQRPSRTETGLSNAERSAFREIARALGARFEDEAPATRTGEKPSPEPERAAPAQHGPAQADQNGDRVLDRLPVGILVHRGERILFANRLLLDLVDYDDIGQISAEGGIVRLFRGSPTLLRSDEGGAPLALSTRHGESIAVEVRMTTVEWDGVPAGLMHIRKIPETDSTQRLRIAEADLRQQEARVRELSSILDTATDGVIVMDETGRILSLNRSAEALFGYDQREVVGDAVTVLFSPESHIVALDYLDGLRSSGVASLLNDGREVMGRVRQGGSIPLFMTMGHVNDGPNPKFCAVLRDITAFKKAEGELLAAKRAAEEASAQKSDLLAKISHEIRTPLNAIIGFAEVMLEERFGPVGNERYKDYLKDVHASGAHVISLVNDLLDLAKIEAGRMELAFTSVSLNDLVGTTVALLQPQAARDRIVMRTSFAAKLPPVVADERSLRQIVLNLVSNAIKFTDAGGQVIVSTALTDRGEVAFRVRDTGIGMTEQEIEAALEPFRQLATSRKRGGTGLGLPLTKALVEANRGGLQISSSPNEGTLVEVIFPPTRVLAE